MGKTNGLKSILKEHPNLFETEFSQDFSQKDSFTMVLKFNKLF